MASLRGTVGMRQRSRNGKVSAGKNMLYALLLGLVLIFIAPFLWLVSIALKTGADLAAFPIRWLPAVPQWSNFQQAVTVVDFWHYTQNSLVISLIFAILVTASSSFVGFGFARLKAPGKRVLFILMLSTLMLPQIITLIPTYIIFARVGLTDTYWPWVLWGLGASAFLVFLFRQFFSSIPQELEDAAFMDGAGHFRIFWQIFLPNSLPVLATGFLLSFVTAWGDYIGPTLLLSQDNTTLAVALAKFYVDPVGNALPTVQAAASILYILPVLLLFFGAQRFFVRGIVTTGSKG